MTNILNSWDIFFQDRFLKFSIFLDSFWRNSRFFFTIDWIYSWIIANSFHCILEFMRNYFTELKTFSSGTIWQSLWFHLCNHEATCLSFFLTDGKVFFFSLRFFFYQMTKFAFFLLTINLFINYLIKWFFTIPQDKIEIFTKIKKHSNSNHIPVH